LRRQREVKKKLEMASSHAAARLCNAGAAAAMVSASYLLARAPVSADKTLDPGSFFPSSPSTASASSTSSSTPAKETEKPRNDAPRTSAVGFDPEALERGAKALREINSSTYAKKVRISIPLPEISLTIEQHVLSTREGAF
jgi:ATPase family AAA domain-containing protein 3A/B